MSAKILYNDNGIDLSENVNDVFQYNNGFLISTSNFGD